MQNKIISIARTSGHLLANKVTERLTDELVATVKNQMPGAVLGGRQFKTAIPIILPYYIRAIVGGQSTRLQCVVVIKPESDGEINVDISIDFPNALVAFQDEWTKNCLTDLQSKLAPLIQQELPGEHPVVLQTKLS